MMYELALFAGAGGGLLATQFLLGWRLEPLEKGRFRQWLEQFGGFWGNNE